MSSTNRRIGYKLLFKLQFALVLVLTAVLSLAQKLSPLAIEDALQMRTFLAKQRSVFSPDGRWVVYAVLGNERPKSEKTDNYLQTGVPSRSEGEIWISNTVTGEMKDITGGDGANWKPSWSPDGHYVAFLSDRDGSGQAKLWLWDWVKNQLRMACSVPLRASFGIEIEWTPDSKQVLITTVPEGLSVPDYIRRVWVHPMQRSRLTTRPAPGSTVVLYEAGPSVGGDEAMAGTPNFNLDELYLHDLALVDVTSGEVNFVVRGRRIERYLLSPDGSYVAFVVPKRFYKPGSYRRYCDLLTLNLRTMQEHRVASDILLNTVFSWSPDSSWIAYATYGADDRSYELYVAAPNGGEPVKRGILPHETSDGLWLSPIWDPKGDCFYVILEGTLWKTSSIRGGSTALRIADRSVRYVLSQSEGKLWSADGGNSAVVIAHDDRKKQDGFYRIDLNTGGSEMLREDGECYSCSWRGPGAALSLVSPDGQHVAFVAEDAQHPPDLWISDARFRSSRQLTHLNPRLEGYKLGPARIVDWLDGDGNMLHGALLLPPDYRDGQRYPLIVWVYPGTNESNQFDWFSIGTYPGPLNMQLFATRGYAVLFPDEKEQAGRRFDGLVKSVLTGVNRIIELGIADPQRVGVMGHSQGGFATLGLLVETNRFKAAMAADGWADSMSVYGALNPDGSSFQNGQAERQLGGLPWQYPLVYIENSPMYFLNRVETPLLLVHGSEDDALPSFLSDQVFVGMDRLGKEVQYAKYEGESHAPSDWNYANQLDLADRVVAWFNKYLRGSSLSGTNLEEMH